MDAKETQLQYMHLYKEMDASYYALSCAQQLVPSEMDIYYAITVLGCLLYTSPSPRDTR